MHTCVARQIRRTLRDVSKKYWSTITREMREIYTAPSLPAAEALFADSADRWRDQYPAMIQSWENSWNEFVPFLEFPPELRRIVYTTNAIESPTPASGGPSEIEGTSPTNKPRSNACTWSCCRSTRKAPARNDG